MEQIYIFHLAYHSQSAQSGRQALEMRHSQHAKSTEYVIDVLATNYDSALNQAEQEYKRLNPCFVFGDSRPVRVLHWENG